MNRFRRTHSISEEDRNKRIQEIEGKWKNKEELSIDDKIFTCDHLKYEELLLHHFGVDEFFNRTFFGLYPEINERQQIAYEGLVREWNRDINKTNHSDPILQANAQETREEMRQLFQQYLIANYNYTAQEYLDNKFKLLEWSKYRYLTAKRILEQEIRGTEYKLHLNGKEIIFDQLSIAHIFARHYGQTMKPYISDKSHFSQDFYHEEIHLAIEDVFKRIDHSGFYKNDSIEEVTIRFKKNLYRLYCKSANKSVKGIKGAVEFTRLTTFFPLEDKEMLENLDANFEEKKIDDELSVFVARGKGRP